MILAALISSKLSNDSFNIPVVRADHEPGHDGPDVAVEKQVLDEVEFAKASAIGIEDPSDLMSKSEFFFYGMSTAGLTD